MKTRIERRTFLRGLGGVTLAAPFLTSVCRARGEWPDAGAEAVHRDVHPLRVHHDEVLPSEGAWRTRGHRPHGDEPRGACTVHEQDPHSSRHSRDERVDPEQQGLRRLCGGARSGNDPHLNVAGSYFTLQPVTPSGTDPFSFDTAYKFNAMPIGSSLDHVMAQQLSPQGTPLFMRAGNRNDTAQSGISYLKDASAAANASARPILASARRRKCSAP